MPRRPRVTALHADAPARLARQPYPIDLPQCEADVRAEGYREWRMRRYGADGLRCQHQAHYKIGGKNLCTRHAGEAALVILLGEK